ncbi:flagellar hook-length control protein FliK [Salipiger mucosus]|nr:flagellar hook-length control protein FliK [Salipiger mucosus]
MKRRDRAAFRGAPEQPKWATEDDKWAQAVKEGSSSVAIHNPGRAPAASFAAMRFKGQFHGKLAGAMRQGAGGSRTTSQQHSRLTEQKATQFAPKRTEAVRAVEADRALAGPDAFRQSEVVDLAKLPARGGAEGKPLRTRDECGRTKNFVAFRRGPSRAESDPSLPQQRPPGDSREPSLVLGDVGKDPRARRAGLAEMDGVPARKMTRAAADGQFASTGNVASEVFRSGRRKTPLELRDRETLKEARESSRDPGPRIEPMAGASRSISAPPEPGGVMVATGSHAGFSEPLVVVASAASHFWADTESDTMPHDAPAAGLSDGVRTATIGPQQASGMRVDGHTAVLRQVNDALDRLRDGQVELRLDPEELGRVRFRMSHGDSGLVLHIAADRPETLDLLRRHAEQLSAYLSEMGYDTASFSFGSDQQQMGDHGDRDLEAASVARREDCEDEHGAGIAELSGMPGVPSDGLDLKL